MKKIIVFLLLTLTVPALAQEEPHRSHRHHSADGDDDDDEEPEDKTVNSLDFHESKKQHLRMSSAYSLYLPMSRNGSGTAWLPDASPVYGTMLHTGNWTFMFQGDIFIRYNAQDLTGKSVRKESKFDAPNMLMFMGQAKVGNYGLFHFNTMFSGELLTIGSNGYPLLFQTGETNNGKPLIDHQHPHDLFSELSVSYTQAFSRKLDAYVYLGYPGEPALGPTAFMHRPSAMFNPDAPLSHHWQDATHISFGVGTLGIRYGKLKLEGSLFNGREPDENRGDIDALFLDSRSARLSFNPTPRWSFQASRAFLKEPERLHPGNITRTTASATYSRQFNFRSYLTATVVGGQNMNGTTTSNSALAEASIRITRLILHSRVEWVQKSAEELGLVRYPSNKLFDISGITVGASYELATVHPLSCAIGWQITANSTPTALTYIYGDIPVSGQIYLHIYPALMRSH